MACLKNRHAARNILKCKKRQCQSYVSKTLSAGCIGTLLSAKNPYNSVFKDGVQSKFKDAGRAVIDMTNSDICGGREDNPTGWNDITKRGFSVIITNDIEGFNAYRARVKSYKTSLTSDLEKAQTTDTALCSTSTANKLKRLLRKLRAHFHRRCRSQSLWRPIIR